MRRILLALVALASCGGKLDIQAPEDLPERVWFRSSTESFNTDWYVALRDGRIWVKPNEETGERKPGDWELLGNTGIPEGGGLVRFDEPTGVAEISADGCWLHALSTDGVLYRGSDLRTGLGGFHWTDRWGWPLGRGDGLTLEESTARGWSVSDSHPFDADHYEDVFGQEHSVGMGVGHVYRSSPDGARIHFNDWWLPEDWSRQVCAPGRGGVPVLSLSSSASTLFVLTEDGGLYTRLWDFDTAGENDTLTYSYLEAKVSKSVRGLPAEPWLRQPEPPGRITDRLTIFQDGEGNAARVLRVEGLLGGAPGFFEKRIDAEAWSFVETGEPVGGTFLDQRDAGPPQPPPAMRGVMLEGALGKEDSEVELGIELLDYDLFCSPAKLRLSWEGETLVVDGEPLELELHHVHAMLDEVRPQDWWEQGDFAPVRAAILVPDDIARVDDAAGREALLALLGDREVVNFRGDASVDTLELEEIPRSDWFHVPRSEKGREGERFWLAAGGGS